MSSFAGVPVASPWLAAVLAAASLIALLWANPRRKRHRAGLRLTSFGLALVAFAAYANAYFSYLPDVGDLAGPRPWPTALAARALTAPATVRHPRGVVIDLDAPGPASGVHGQRALVYLPPQYFTEPARRFPVLYLLHGSPGVPLDWFRGADAADAGYRSAASGHPVLLVVPRLSRSWLDDTECVDTPHYRAESYLVRDVLQLVDHRLRTQPRREARGLVGNSAGGYCALDIALRHPDTFGSAAGMSPLIEPTYSYGSLHQLFGNTKDFSHVLQRHSPAWLLRHEPATRQVRMRIDVGRQDRLVRRQDEAFVRLTAALAATPTTFVERPGGHTFHVWRPALRDAVQWFASGVARPTAGTGHARGVTPS